MATNIILLHYGINNLIILDTVIISTILNKLRKGLIFSLNVLNSKAELVELEVSNKSLSIGKTVEYLEKNYPIKLGIILRNNDEIKKITKDLVIQEGDRVVYIGSKNNIEIAEKIFTPNELRKYKIDATNIQFIKIDSINTNEVKKKCDKIILFGGETLNSYFIDKLIDFKLKHN